MFEDQRSLDKIYAINLTLANKLELETEKK